MRTFTFRTIPTATIPTISATATKWKLTTPIKNRLPIICFRAITKKNRLRFHEEINLCIILQICHRVGGWFGSFVCKLPVVLRWNFRLICMIRLLGMMTMIRPMLLLLLGIPRAAWLVTVRKRKKRTFALFLPRFCKKRLTRNHLKLCRDLIDANPITMTMMTTTMTTMIKTATTTCILNPRTKRTSTTALPFPTPHLSFDRRKYHSQSHASLTKHTYPRVKPQMTNARPMHEEIELRC
mmetsp:Transcript_43791/g.64322  ORF Transcript_43791/g.64322 Transcript_43791/m.64322 type:complete len:239 (-) Transcript_43791:1899-2615(-)